MGVAVLVVVVLLLALVFGGVLKLGGSGSPSGTGGPGPTGLTYRQALNQANQSVVSARGGGPWHVAYASMIDSSFTYDHYIWGPCSPEGYSPNASALVAQGEAYDWFFVFVTVPFSLSYSHAIYVSVWNDSGALVSQVDPMTMCTSYGVQGLLAGNISDSPQALTAAAQHGGSQFLALHPNATVVASASYTFDLSIFAYDLTWRVDYQTVELARGPQPYSGLSVVLNGTTLALQSSNWVNGTFTSSGARWLAYPVQFAFSSSGSSAGGTLFFDNVTMTVPASLGMTTDNLSLAILQSNLTLVNNGALGGCVPPGFPVCGAPGGGGWITLLSKGGTLMDAYPAAPGSYAWSNSGGTVGISGTVTLEIISSFALAGTGDTLRAFSNGAQTTGSIVL